jgi:hypothetical protein
MEGSMKTFAIRALLSTIAVAGIWAGPASASEMINFTTVTNTDVATFGLGAMRGTGTGSLAVSGLSGTVSQAYLYWHGPTNSADPSANASVNFGGSAIVGSNIGFSQDNFWGFQNSQSYRADVTSLVSAAGNSSYALSNFIKPGVEVNGLSLIVFYDDGVAANNSDVVLFNGNDANFLNAFDAPGWNATLAGINYSGGTASMTLHVSDGQDFQGPDDGILLLNGLPLASGDIFQGDGVQLGTSTVVPNGALWDIETYDISSFLVPGNNNLTLNMSAVNDAIALTVVQFNLPVGAAPPPASGVPEPATWAMMIGGFGMIGAAMRYGRRRKVTNAGI